MVSSAAPPSGNTTRRSASCHALGASWMVISNSISSITGTPSRVPQSVAKMGAKMTAVPKPA